MSNTPDRSVPAQIREIAGLWFLFVFLGIVLIVCLLFHIRTQEEDSVQQARISLTLNQLKESIESEIALGFDLPDNSNIQSLMDRALASDPQIHAIDVVDRHGIALFSTDRGIVGEPWQTQVAEAAQIGLNHDQSWTASLAGDEAIMGQPLHSAFGEAIGQVGVTYGEQRTYVLPSPANDSARILITLPFGVSMVISAIVALVLGLAAAWWALRPQRQLLAAEHTHRLAQANQHSNAVRERLNMCLVQLDQSERAQ